MYKKILKLANSVDVDNKELAQSLCKGVSLNFERFIHDRRYFEGDALVITNFYAKNYLKNIDMFESDEYESVSVLNISKSNLIFDSLPKLEPTLDFRFTECSLNHFKKWISFSKVKRINIHACDDFKESIFEDLDMLQNIYYLSLSHLTHIKSINLNSMQAFEKIKYFYLSNNKGFGRSNKDIYELEVDNLRVFKNLKEIRFEFVNINEKMIDDICSIKSLETIVFVNNKQEIPKEWFLKILNCNSAVKYLSISDKNGVLLFDSSKRKV